MRAFNSGYPASILLFYRTTTINTQLWRRDDSIITSSPAASEEESEGEIKSKKPPSAKLSLIPTLRMKKSLLLRKRRLHQLGAVERRQSRRSQLI